ncbi:MAG TPA: EthD family reductase [Dehalococcoidia bacterium]|nr:EthD family reductase [Dehalococcoidia bacterium]
MIKFIGVVYRRPDLTHEQAARHWQEVHGPLALHLPGLRQYIQNHVVTRPGREPDLIGFAEVWFDDDDARRAAFRSEAGRTVLADEPNFIDLSRSYGAVVTEALMYDESPSRFQGGGRPAGKLMVPILRRPDLTHDEMIRYWRDTHAPIALGLPGLRRYVQSRAVVRPGREPRVDGFAEVWFDDEDTLRAAVRGEVGARLLADEANLVAGGRTYGAVVKEVMMLAGGVQPTSSPAQP